MSRTPSVFVQLHLLTAYGPANLNRDDLGRPKTAMMGGAQRLRVSSQSLKRAWRTSDLFRNEFEDTLGIRTKEIGEKVYLELRDNIENAKADEIGKKVGGVFAKLKKEGRETEQLAHVSAQEHRNVMALVQKVRDGAEPTDEDFQSLLTDGHGSPDVALFGRMLAADPQCNVEAAAQVAHAVSVHKVAVEDDFFTAVDDLNLTSEDLGAGHMGVTEFGSGLFYQYLCINRTLLKSNLGGDEDLTTRSLKTLTEACATIAPTGKQASFASRARASYLLAERGSQQPRSLAVAFFSPVAGTNVVHDAIRAMEETRDNMNRVYGPCFDAKERFDVPAGEGTLEKVKNFVGAAL